NIKADTEAYIDTGVTATAGGRVEVIADGTQVYSNVNAQAGSGGIVGLGASVARSWVNATVKAYVVDASTLATKTTITAGTVNIKALSTITTHVTSSA